MCERVHCRLRCTDAGFFRTWPGGHEQPDGFVECSKCGVIFGKIHTHEEKNHIRIDENVESGPSSPAETLKGLFFSVKTDPDPIILSLKAILIAIILIWGLKLFFTPIEDRGPFGASMALWWFGENFIDMAPYINDARALQLTLLGGVTGKDRPGFHDWENILGTLGMLPYDHAIASAAMWLGLICMITACAWAGFLLFKELSALKQGRST